MKIKALILIFLILASTAQAQTKKKITELTADTTPTSDDILEVTNDPTGTPGSRKVSIGDFTKGLVAASTTNRGVVTTGAQSFAGFKTFGTSAIFNEDGNDADFRIEGDNDSNLFFLDASEDKIGIGTSSPGAKLHVIGDAIVSGEMAASIISGSTSVNGRRFIMNDNNEDIDSRFEGVNDSNLFYVDAGTDRIGIGIFAPTEKLDVNGTVKAIGFKTTGQSQFGNGVAGIGLGAIVHIVAENPSTIPLFKISQDGNDGDVLVMDPGGNTVFNDGGVPISFRIESNNDANLFITDSTNDRVGIGTSTPAHKLDVNGAAVVTDLLGHGSLTLGADGDFGTFPSLVVQSGTGYVTISAGRNLIGATGSVLDWQGNAIFNETGIDVDFRIESDNLTDAFFVDASTDNVGIGISTPLTRLHVNGTFRTESGATLNESGGDSDTRIEGDNDANLIYVDASTDRVGIGTSTPATKLDVNGTITATNLTSTNSTVDTLNFVAGQQIFNSSSRLVFRAVSGEDTLILSNGNGSSTVFNENGTNSDLRIEGQDDVSLFFVDASANSIGINVGNPAAKLDILTGAVESPILTYTSTATSDDVSVTLTQGRAATTNATPATIRTISIGPDRTYKIRAEVIARRTSGAAGTADDGAGYTKEWFFTTKSSVVTQLGTDVDIATREDQGGWDFDATISGTDVLLQVTGAVDNNVSWHLVKCEVSSIGG